jgi:hypothetical protein
VVGRQRLLCRARDIRQWLVAWQRLFFLPQQGSEEIIRSPPRKKTKILASRNNLLKLLPTSTPRVQLSSR